MITALLDPLSCAVPQLGPLSTPCLMWLGPIDKQGYGRVYRWDGNPNTPPQAAHRLAYQLNVGSIPDNSELDHLCNRPLCINTVHLDPVSQVENQRRAAIVYYDSTCDNGHLRTEANTYTTPAGHRACRECHRDASRAYRARKRGEATSGPGSGSAQRQRALRGRGWA